MPKFIQMFRLKHWPDLLGHAAQPTYHAIPIVCIIFHRSFIISLLSLAEKV